MAPAGHPPGGGAPGSGHDTGIRASDRDRERAVQLLGDAHAEGRLDLDELTERIGAAYSAKVWEELAELTADLPADQRFVPVRTGGDSPELTHCGPPHSCAALWPVAIFWLAVAVAVHVAAAFPLMLLAAVALRVTCWWRPPGSRSRNTR
jgi:uncharacterized protein DUF1707